MARKTPAAEKPAEKVAATPEPDTTETTETQDTQMTEETPTTDLATTETMTQAKANKALAARLPARYQEDVLFLSRPTPAQMMSLVEALPGDRQQQMIDLIRKTRPKKQGVHTSKEGFQPTEVKLYHGTGNDPVRPPKMPPGEFYSSDSRVMGDSIVGVVLGLYEGRILWPAQGSESKAPICVSMDQQTGSKYGECENCSLARKPYNQGGCAKEVVVFFIDQDFTGIYAMRFSKSSQGAGAALVAILRKSDNIWERWYTFETKERVEKDRRWYVIKANPVLDPKNPSNERTSRELHPLFEALSKVLDADVYYPQLADLHDRAKNAAGDSPAPAGEAFDEKALMGAGDDENPDYSGNV